MVTKQYIKEADTMAGMQVIEIYINMGLQKARLKVCRPVLPPSVIVVVIGFLSA